MIDEAPPYPDDDAEIVAALAEPRRCDAGMRALLDRYGARLHARARQLVGAGGEADDVLQDALVKVLANARHFDGRSALGTWLHRVVTNQALDHLRARERRLRRESAPASGGCAGHAALDTLPPDRINALLLGAIAALPPQQRQVFEERYFHETPYADIAARTGKSVGGLKANYHHAVAKVTAQLRAHVAALPTP